MTHDPNRPTPDAPAHTPALTPSPNQRDLYLLVLGIIAGVLLGPGVLGRAAPQTYNRLFQGADLQAIEQLQHEHGEALESISRLEATGVTESAIEEFRNQIEARLEPLRLRLAAAEQLHLQQLQQRLTAIILSVVILMAVETLLLRRGQSKLATARYALVAVWLAIVIAQPALLANLPLTFALLLTLVAAAVALVPLPRRA